MPYDLILVSVFVTVIYYISYGWIINLKFHIEVTEDGITFDSSYELSNVRDQEFINYIERNMETQEGIAEIKDMFNTAIKLTYVLAGVNLVMVLRLIMEVVRYAS